MGQKSKMTALSFHLFRRTWSRSLLFGHMGLGALKLITVGGFGVWWLIDIFLIASNKMTTKDGNALV